MVVNRAAPAGSHGLLVLPYFAGERTPIYGPLARGTIIGLTLEHDRSHLLRAVYEGVAFGMRQMLEAMAEVVGPPARIVAVGSGTRGGLWTQIVSDVIKQPQILPRVRIGAAYGSALLAAIGVGAVAPGSVWCEVELEVRPDPTSSAVYDELYSIYTSLYPKTKGAMHALAALQERSAR